MGPRGRYLSSEGCWPHWIHMYMDILNTYWNMDSDNRNYNAALVILDRIEGTWGDWLSLSSLKALFLCVTPAEAHHGPDLLVSGERRPDILQTTEIFCSRDTCELWLAEDSPLRACYFDGCSASHGVNHCRFFVDLDSRFKKTFSHMTRELTYFESFPTLLKRR